MSAKENLAPLIDFVLPEVLAIRHHLHRHPELSHHEEKTAALVAGSLRELQLDNIRVGVAGTGVIAEIEGEAGKGPTLALRADMDALAIQETADRPYRSEVPGVMHACGHDGHTSVLLGTAAVLAGLRPQLRGTIRFLFQPAEETIGGADAMCAEGAIDGVDAVVALHGWPNLEAGQIGIRSGPIMASADTFDITVIGHGGHAAYPHTTIDPIVIGAQLVSALQTLASRETSPLEPVVVTVGQFHAGTAYNVVPDRAEIKGTVRCLSKTLRAEMPGKIERIIAGVCAAFQAQYRFKYTPGTPVTVNDPDVADLVRAVGRDILGENGVVELSEPTMGAEDFAFYLEHVPGAMFRLGVGTQTSALHTPTYDFGDDATPYGIAMMAGIALSYCGV